MTVEGGLTCYYGVVAYILPDPAPFGGLLAWCDHGTPLGHTCWDCRRAEPAAAPGRASASPPAAPTGWLCASCGHSYAPWVPECHHCPVPPAFIAKGEGLG